MNSAPSPWSLAADPSSAILRLPAWTGSVRLDAAVLSFAPNDGTQGPASGPSCELRVLIREKQAGPYDLREAYVRGEDLVLTYGQEADLTIRPQIYFSARSEALSSIVIDVQVLVQTDLLQSTPETSVRCLPPRTARLDDSSRDGEWIQFHDGDLIWACGAPSNDGNLRILDDQASDHPTAAEVLLFDREQLEKGVIQRGRFRVIAVRRQAGAEQLLTRLRQQFAESPPPLSV